MNFLKSAVASAISQGPPFPYSFGDRVDVHQSIWTLYNGTKREDGSNCSIFSFEIGPSNKSYLPLARNALRKLRTLRHPGVIKVFDTVETETYIYIATERVTPLRWFIKRQSLSPETLKWGLFSVGQTLKFINDEAASIHGCVRVGSIFTSESGEWKVAGFEVLSSMKEDDGILYSYGSLVPDSGRYAAPEVGRSGWDVVKRNPITALDSYNYGTLIYETFNGDFAGADQAGQPKSIPPSMHSGYKRLVSSNPKARLSIAHFLEQGRRRGGVFDTPLIKLTENVDNLGVKTEEEREEFLNGLDDLSEDFPEEYFSMKVLPELLKSVEFGGGGPKALSVVMKISKKLTDDDFDAKVTPVIVRLFGNPDRALRVALLDNLPLMIDRLSQKVVSDKIFPQMTTGFTDVAPVVREQTVKAVLTIITKLSDRTINGELLKYLAKTANDEQPGIRTNTTICLGKIARNLGTSTRSKVLIAAFSRSLRDPFVHARNAALLAFAVTPDIFSEDDCANRILPGLCPMLIDKEKLIRDQASKTLDVYLQKVRKAAAAMPDTTQTVHADNSSSNTPRMGTPQLNSGDTWTGWAISSFTNKLSAAAGEISTEANGKPHGSEVRSSSAPAPHDVRRPNTHTASASALHRQVVASPPPASSRTSTSSNPQDYFQDANEGADDFDDAWGEMQDDDDDTLADAPVESIASKPKTPVVKTAANPFDDGGEPDFAGWLAAQNKKPSSKPLPKGLSKSSPAVKTLPSAAKKPLAAKSKPVVAKKIETKPKATEVDDDAWGDAW